MSIKNDIKSIAWELIKPENIFLQGAACVLGVLSFATLFLAPYMAALPAAMCVLCEVAYVGNIMYGFDNNKKFNQQTSANKKEDVPKVLSDENISEFINEENNMVVSRNKFLATQEKPILFRGRKQTIIPREIILKSRSNSSVSDYSSDEDTTKPLKEGKAVRKEAPKATVSSVITSVFNSAYKILFFGNNNAQDNREDRDYRPRW